MADVAAPARTLPHNLEAEKSVLGAILIHNEAFNHAAELLDSRDFFRDAHRRIFDKMIGLSERGDAIDFVTLKEELSRSGDLEEVGGPAYIASLADGVPRSANVEYYAKIVKEKSTLRSLIHSANKILTDAYEAEEEPDLLLDEAERAIFAIAEDRMRAGFVPLRDLVQSSFTTIEKLQQHKGMVTGVPTGFVELDEMTSGLQPSDLVHRRGAAVDGQDQLRPQHRPARRHRHRHDRRLLLPRNVEGAAVHAPADRRGAHRRAPVPQRLPQREGLRAAVARARHAGRGAGVHRRHGLDRRPRDAREGAAAQGRARAPPDHHRLHPADVRGAAASRSRQAEIASISRSLKGLAKELGVPIVALSQLSRASETRADHRPQLSDLRESGALEQDADVVMFIYREEQYREADGSQKEGVEGTAEIIVGKQRNGPIGTVKLAFIKEHTRFENLAHGGA